jgi:hypothetical protein
MAGESRYGLLLFLCDLGSLITTLSMVVIAGLNISAAGSTMQPASLADALSIATRFKN